MFFYSGTIPALPMLSVFLFLFSLNFGDGIIHGVQSLPTHVIKY